MKVQQFNLECYLETHYQVVEMFCKNAECEKLVKIHETEGIGGMWEFAKEITDDFETIYQNEMWNILDWFETLEIFIHRKLFEK